MGLGTQNVVQGQDFDAISATKEMRLGSIAETADGRAFRYALAGGTTVAPGKIVVAATVNANVSNVTVAASVAAGVKEVVIDAGGAIAGNAYADGYLAINDATGEGHNYSVRGNSTTSGAGELTVFLNDPVASALTVDVSEATLTANPWGGVVVSVADQLDMCVGVPSVSITNAYYGWVQTRGVTSVLADETIAIGQALTIGSSTAGAVEAADLVGEQIIGVAMVAGVDTEYRQVYLQID